MYNGNLPTGELCTLGYELNCQSRLAQRLASSQQGVLNRERFVLYFLPTPKPPKTASAAFSRLSPQGPIFGDSLLHRTFLQSCISVRATFKDPKPPSKSFLFSSKMRTFLVHMLIVQS